VLTLFIVVDMQKQKLMNGSENEYSTVRQIITNTRLVYPADVTHL